VTLRQRRDAIFEVLQDEFRTKVSAVLLAGFPDLINNDSGTMLAFLRDIANNIAQAFADEHE